MSFLSALFGNYADDAVKSAAKTAVKSAAKNKADDVLRATITNKSDDIAAKTIKNVAKNKTDDVVRKVATNKSDDIVRNAAKNKLDDVATTAAKKSTKSTATQKLARSDFEDFVNGFGSVNTKTRQELLKDYTGGGKIWEKLRSMNIDPANVQDVSGKALSSFGNVKQALYDYADNAGVGIDVSDVFGKSNPFTKVQKTRLAEAGLDLDAIAKNGVITANQADKLYSTLRDLGIKYNSATDATQNVLGGKLDDLAKSLRDRIDDSLNPTAKSFGLKRYMVDAANEIGDTDLARRLSGSLDDDITVSLLRREQQPYMIANQNLVGLKTPTTKTINVFGMDTGAPNPMPKVGKAVGRGVMKAKVALENHPGIKNAAIGGLGVLGGLLGATALSGGNGGNQSGNMGTSMLGGLTGDLSGLSGGNGMNTALGGSNATTGVLSGNTGNSTSTLGGYSYEQLENAYVAAIMAGDSGAAGVIADMIDMLAAKDKRNSSSSNSGDEKAKAGLNTLSELYSLYNSFGGSQGVVKGNLTGLLNTITGGSYNPQAAAFDSIAEGSIGRIVKAMGDSGALSDSDKQNALKMIPKVSDSPALAEQKFQSLYNLLLQAANGS